MRRAAFWPATPPWITTWVSLFARMLIGISPSVRRGLFLLERHVDDVRQRRFPVVDLDVEPFVLQLAHQLQAFLLVGAAAADPDLHALELAVTLGLAEP